MVEDMMKPCCGEGGKPDFEKMMQFMEKCGKEQFSEDEIAKMKGMCGGEDMPDFAKMKQFMERCGCRLP